MCDTLYVVFVIGVIDIFMELIYLFFLFQVRSIFYSEDIEEAFIAVSKFKKFVFIIIFKPN